MPIGEHENLGLEVGPRGALAAGSSNSNSHNAGGSTELTKPELEQVISQLSDLLPQLQQVVRQQPSAPQ